MRPLIAEKQGKPLSDLQAEILRGYWNKATQQVIAKKMGCEVQHIKNESTSLYKNLSEITG
jgi:hypothetical protein